MNVYDVLKNSYADQEKQKSALSRYGYKYDSMLSNRDNAIYYNPTENKLLHTVAGTHRIADIGTDAYLAIGKLKDTGRYKDSHNLLLEAKHKYQPAKTVVAGTSLGGAIAGYIASGNDEVYTLNKGATIGQKVRANEHAYRTDGDVVSILDENSKHMKTLPNHNKSTGFLPLDTLKAHSVENLKNENIFI